MDQVLHRCAQLGGTGIWHRHHTEQHSITLCYFGNINQYTNYFEIGLIHTDTLGDFAWGKNYQITNFTTEFSYKVLQMPYGYAITGFGSGGGSGEPRPQAA